MKVMTILGTRPELIRLCLIISQLDKYAEQHILVHTGQNYDDRLNRIFFEEMEIRKPDELMGVDTSSFANQIGEILSKSEALFLKHRPDRLLILGDTNSGLSAIVAKRLGIPVYHMEAGNRCYDDRVPEEVNRRVIDHSSTVLMPYTNRSKENLLKEGFPLDRVFVIGNPIKEVIDHFETKIEKSSILAELGLNPGEYFLVTMHRAENVDDEDRLRELINSLELLSQKFSKPVVCSFHPRTKAKVQRFNVDIERKGLVFLPPFGFFDFIKLEKSAFCVLSDSGTVQEEACIFRIANVTIRDVTERPETVECGSNILSGANCDSIIQAVKMATERKGKWNPPTEYLAENVTNTVCNIVLGYKVPDLAEQQWKKYKSNAV